MIIRKVAKEMCYLFSRISKSFYRFTQFVCAFSRNSIAKWENELHNSMQQFVLLPLKKSLCHFRVFNLYIFLSFQWYTCSKRKSQNSLSFTCFLQEVILCSDFQQLFLAPCLLYFKRFMARILAIRRKTQDRHLMNIPS